MAPASAKPGMFLDADGKPRAHFDAIPGGLSVGIPGGGRHARIWRIRNTASCPGRACFQPAIKLAENGFPVGPKLARTIAGATRGAKMPDIRKSFLSSPTARRLAEGEIYKNPEYAAAAPAQDREPKARMDFYKGDIAAAIVECPFNMRRASRAA